MAAPAISLGVAKVEVTPAGPVVLAGYGGRTTELEGVDTPLWIRAVVMGDEQPLAVVVVDNCGVPAALKGRLVKRLARHGISSERLVVAATHTHNAPNLTGYAPVLWAGRMTPEQEKHMADYTTFAIARMEQAVVRALSNRQPMHLEWAQGRVTFGGNRRVMRNGEWAGFGFQRNAPVDHSLPVLAARDSDGEIRMIWANYACHCTTLGSVNRVGGDWAGFANEWMEKSHPNAITLMSIGCGADIGPQPSGNAEVAEQHGQAIAAEVNRLLDHTTKALSELPKVYHRQIQLPLETPQPRSHWNEQLASGDFHAQLAKAMIHQLDHQGSIPDNVNYPVSVWQFGRDLAMVFLAGEVVVDYSVRLNRELDWSRLWITAWANDMPGYIPSRRILSEGGYEADFSQVYYQLPGRYKPEVENILVEAVLDMVGSAFVASEDQSPAPFHKLPSGEKEALRKAGQWLSRAGEGEKAMAREFAHLIKAATPGLRQISRSDGETTEWYDFAGDLVGRDFIRQQTKGPRLEWMSPILPEIGSDKFVLCFSGGIGWQSQPQTKGFALLVNEGSLVEFDVVRQPAKWISTDSKVALYYLTTWTSNEDSAGFWFLVVDKSVVGEDEALKVSVQSLGEGSQRWFGIDRRQDVAALLKKLQVSMGETAPDNHE